MLIVILENKRGIADANYAAANNASAPSLVDRNPTFS